MSRQMRLGLFLLGTGSHISGWRMPGAVDSFEDIGQITAICQEAERGLFDLIFMGDNLNADPKAHPSYCSRLEPLTMLSAVSMVTKHIGLGATSSTTYGDPWTLARAFASLDHISGGRAAWNSVTTSAPQAAANFGKVHPDHARRYEMSAEFIAVVNALWTAWEEGATPKDPETGQYFDAAKIHAIDHDGEFFKVKGPVNITRPPQGRPLILQAGGSEPGQELAAKHADVVFTVTQDRDEAIAFYDGLKARLPKNGRGADSMVVLPGVMPVVGRTEAEAREKLSRLMSFVDDDTALGMLSERFNTDMSGYDLDGPIPDLGENDAYHAFAAAMLSKARRENMRLRDLYALVAAARGHWVLCGSAEQVADTLQDWFESGAADGFNIMPGWFMEGFTDFIDLVVPILQDRGLYKNAYAEGTLRDKLGLPA
ncbi:LLM class flavin-dependent oxidoreductase [Pseudooceanicola sp. CBS1P-1]|uniref:NtaA/DmoA family FMN-dependent monooxygenase n=1 Tax=Pseudooceanicola albus TaxID=2692189 RepID=A0A6L7G2N8_9RHOB|nr:MULTISPECIES: LLM class flavin-dependent oxidoreductase [Pseudooceanicola]MBT9385074.1 LLM class flavin-dependent oxidoreductase [Pseudooceanicola endophyticus]MXN18634.1 NtaA/DmoA family FMN-dependent monooxygenase [Pseudooceanicola albus]